LRNVFDVSCARVAGPLQSSAAIGAARRLVRFFPIDSVGRAASAAGMAFFRPRPLLSRLRGQLLVDRNHARRRAGRDRWFDLFPRLGELLGQFEQRKNNGSRSLAINLQSLLLAERSRAQRLARCLVQRFQAS